ncbi:hypothetical protein SALBM311S_02499 [Streptomyces alboniger]
MRLVTDGVTVTAMTTGFWAGRRLRGRPAPAVTERTPWHSMTVRQVMTRLGTSSRGLDEAEAARRRPSGGRDRRAGAVTLVGRVAEELANPLTPVLAIGGGISAALGSVVDAVLIGGVLGVDALVGGVQQQKADHAAGRGVWSRRPRCGCGCVARTGPRRSRRPPSSWSPAMWSSFRPVTRCRPTAGWCRRRLWRPTSPA